MRLMPSAVTVLAAAVLPMALVGCSSSGADTAPVASPSGPAPTSADPNAGLLTGSQLKKALAPASFFASGFAIDAAATRDTGGTYVEPAVAAVPKPDCAKLGGTSWIDITGISGVSFAQDDYVNKNTSAEIAQEIDVYRGPTAKAVMEALAKVSVACPSFKDSGTSSKVKVSERAATGLGDEAYIITLTDPTWESGTTMVAARIGTAVVTVLSSEGKDNGAVFAKKLTRHIASALNGKA